MRMCLIGCFYLFRGQRFSYQEGWLGSALVTLCLSQPPRDRFQSASVYVLATSGIRTLNVSGDKH